MVLFEVLLMNFILRITKEINLKVKVVVNDAIKSGDMRGDKMEGESCVT